ncbi:MAG: Zn-dependent hydrolase [Rhodospirillales bacterium]|jgi:N-carbamoyl-L-amino-acid hydrolase|nr:Zn-dependent hydrolase [Rhodospirillales bacterium]
MSIPAIDGERLWSTLMEMAHFGATPMGGVCRLALTDEDKAARDLFSRWCAKAGCGVVVDKMGNVFARRSGRDNDLPPIIIGSHLDSQPTGGKFDGAYGVLAGLEVIRTLNDHTIETEAPIEVVSWTNEEGARFQPPMVGSGVFAGAFDLEESLAAKDLEGNSLGGELARIGYAGSAEVGGRPVTAYFEPHIEQGPILEAEDMVIGVVTGAQGQRWFEATVTGQEAHAGPPPMDVRRDALVGAARMIGEVRRIGVDHAPNGRSTVGFVTVHPNSRNVIPGSVFFSVDLRHPDDGALAAMGEALREACSAVAHNEGLKVKLDEILYFPAHPFDADCVRAVREGAEVLGHSHRDIISGAGHDAVYLSRVAPTGMIFVPCKDGISHAEIEYAKLEDLTAGCNVLLRAVLERAGS